MSLTILQTTNLSEGDSLRDIRGKASPQSILFTEGPFKL